jgi:hypothetical protein
LGAMQPDWKNSKMRNLLSVKALTHLFPMSVISIPTHGLLDGFQERDNMDLNVSSFPDREGFQVTWQFTAVCHPAALFCPPWPAILVSHICQLRRHGCSQDVLRYLAEFTCRTFPVDQVWTRIAGYVISDLKAAGKGTTTIFLLKLT